jgi:HSP20 family molecular chaperone IbpA
MSSTTTKNILLSQPKIGSAIEVSSALLTHNTRQTSTETVVEIEIPGVDPATVDVQCENNSLAIVCSKGQLNIPVEPTADISKIKADIQWGLLTLRIPAPEVPQARAIKVSIHDAAPKTEQRPTTKTHTATTKASTKEFTVAE